MNTLVDSVTDTNKLAEWIKLQTHVAKNCLNKQLKDWSSDSQHLQNLSTRFKRFKVAFEKNPKLFAQCSSIFKEIADIEQKIKLS